jgi:hypothetical protein
VIGVAALAGSAAAAQSIVVKETDYKIKLASKPKAGKVTFVVKNMGHDPRGHDLWIKGGGKTAHTKVLKRGKSAKLTFTLKKGVRYKLWCAVDSHVKFGMVTYFKT